MLERITVWLFEPDFKHNLSPDACILIEVFPGSKVNGGETEMPGERVRTEHFYIVLFLNITI